jgi:hypothetical protein
VIARREHAPPASIPDDEGKIAQEVVHARLAPACVGMQDQFVAAHGLQIVGAVGQLCDQEIPVVDPHVAGNPAGVVQRGDLRTAVGFSRRAEMRVTEAGIARHPRSRRAAERRHCAIV